MALCSVHPCEVSIIDETEKQWYVATHFAVMLKEDSSLQCLKTLIEYGAHIDAVNQRNETPLDLALYNVGYAENKENIISYLSNANRKYSTLQCLSAKVLVKQCIPYEAILPGFLVSFVSEHETDGFMDINDEEMEKKTGTDN